MIDVSAALSVSRETSERLDHYFELLKKWNPVINLVAKSTLNEAPARHFLDSAQLYKLAHQPWSKWCDIGSGGGFPGLVVATLAAEFNPNGTIILIESDKRKATFLRNVARELDLKVEVVSERIEEVHPLQSDVMSARALAHLSDLLNFAQRHLSPDGQALFPKGLNWQQEVETAQENWSFQCEVHKSIVESNSVILDIGGIARG